MGIAVLPLATQAEIIDVFQAAGLKQPDISIRKESKKNEGRTFLFTFRISHATGIACNRLVKRAIEVLNELEGDGVFSRYAIGGAMGAIFYTELF